MDMDKVTRKNFYIFIGLVLLLNIWFVFAVNHMSHHRAFGYGSCGGMMQVQQQRGYQHPDVYYFDQNRNGDGQYLNYQKYLIPLSDR